MNNCGKNVLRSKSAKQYEFAQDLVEAGLCSARQKAQNHRKSSADSYAPAHSAVGADAHIGPLGSHEFAEDFHKTGAFCGRTGSSAPTGESEDRCRGRRLLSAHWEAVNSPQSPKASPCRAPHGKRRWLGEAETEGIGSRYQSTPKFAAFESPQSASLTASLPLLALRAISP